MDNFSLEYKSFQASKGWAELTVPPLCKVGIHCILSDQYKQHTTYHTNPSLSIVQ